MVINFFFKYRIKVFTTDRWRKYDQATWGMFSVYLQCMFTCEQCGIFSEADSGIYLHTLNYAPLAFTYYLLYILLIWFQQFSVSLFCKILAYLINFVSLLYTHLLLLFCPVTSTWAEIWQSELISQFLFGSI